MRATLRIRRGPAWPARRARRYQPSQQLRKWIGIPMNYYELLWTRHFRDVRKAKQLWNSWNMRWCWQLKSRCAFHCGFDLQRFVDRRKIIGIDYKAQSFEFNLKIRFESHLCTNTMEIAILVSLLRPTAESYGPSCILRFSDNTDKEIIVNCRCESEAHVTSNVDGEHRSLNRNYENAAEFVSKIMCKNVVQIQASKMKV